MEKKITSIAFKYFFVWKSLKNVYSGLVIRRNWTYLTTILVQKVFAKMYIFNSYSAAFMKNNVA